MRAVVSPGQIGIEGSPPLLYNPPPSKSHFQRLCAAALLRPGTTTIANPGRSQDDAAALDIIEELGATVQRAVQFGEEVFIITSNGVVKPRTGVIHCGESGLSARLFAPIAALADVPVEIHGDGSLLARPMHGVISALGQLGVTVSSSAAGRLPITVHGPLQPRSITVDGTQSSQIISGILYSLAASTTSPIVLRAEGLVSRPYLEMSCDVLQWLGWDVSFDGIETCYISPRLAGPATHFQIETESDWSSIAPIAVAAAFGGSGIRLDEFSSEIQADAMILDILDRANADVDEMQSRDNGSVSPGPLQAFIADCTHSPDLIPILAVLATACEGQSRISGLHRLTHKESDRTKTTSALLTALKITHSIENDAFVITGPQTPRSNTVSGHKDHRIVMAAAIAALRADGPVTIEGAEAVRKSYPDFFGDLQKLGVHVEIFP